MPLDADLASRLGRPDLPPSIDRWRLMLPPGTSRPTSAGEWTGCLVLVERGTIEVDCSAGGSRSFVTGDLLTPGWLPVRTLRNSGTEDACLLAVRRRRPAPGPLTALLTRLPFTIPRRGERTTMTFRTVIELGGKTATGIRVPDAVVAGLGAGKRPAVLVRIGSHQYRSTVGVMDGVAMLPLSAENREAAGVAAGDDVEVRLELDTAPREVTVPDDLAAALDADPEARRTFDALSYSNKRVHVESVTGAKTDETRQRRIAKSVATLHEGRPR